MAKIIKFPSKIEKTPEREILRQSIVEFDEEELELMIENIENGYLGMRAVFFLEEALANVMEIFGTQKTIEMLNEYKVHIINNSSIDPEGGTEGSL